MQKTDIEWQKMADFTKNNGENLILNLNAPVQFNDEGVVKTHENWRNKFSDEWVNPVANVGVNNSIMQYSEWINNRLSYAECAFLANDSIINNALTKIANEMLRKGGEIVIDSEDEAFVNELKAKIESRLKELDFWHILHKAIVTSLTYGGALIFTDCNAEELDKPLYENKAIFSQNPINALKVVEPYLCGANNVNATNPLNADFMIPNMWFISGGGQVHKSRIETLIMFESPDMIKPLYNYLGISLCQFMRDYVMSADISRKGLADIFQRFRTIIIKSPLIKNNIDQAIKRINAINRQRNNNSAIALTEDEDYIETITSITGLDKLIAQMQENIAISARIPAVKLLGLTPSGFNATGDFDMRSYYDEIMSLQNAILKPIINRYLHFICLEFGYDLKPDFEFNRLDSDNALNEVQIKNTEAQMMLNLIQGGVITQETAFNYLRNKGILPNSAEFENDLDSDLGDLGLDSPNNSDDNMPYNHFMDWVFDVNKNFSNNAMYDLERNNRPLSFFTRADIREFERLLELPPNSVDRQTFYNFLKDKGKVIETNKNSEYFNEHTWHHLGENANQYYFYSLNSAIDNSSLKDIKTYFKDFKGDFKNKEAIKKDMNNFLSENLENDLRRVDKDYPAKDDDYDRMDKAESNGDKSILSTGLYKLNNLKNNAEQKTKIYKQLKDILSARSGERDFKYYQTKFKKYYKTQGSGEWDEKEHPRNPDGSFKKK